MLFFLDHPLCLGVMEEQGIKDKKNDSSNFSLCIPLINILVNYMVIHELMLGSSSK